MMRTLIASALMLLGLAGISCSSASATSFGSFRAIGPSAPPTAAIIKVHSSQEVHDMLHGYRYDHVVYQSRSYDDDDKPVYRFRACQGRRAYLVDVNWYGQIIEQYRAGHCRRYDW